MGLAGPEGLQPPFMRGGPGCRPGRSGLLAGRLTEVRSRSQLREYYGW